MLRPKLLPDELVGSYKGAIARLNGLAAASPSSLESALRKFLIQSDVGVGATSAPPMHRLAAVAGVDPDHLRRHHTLGPFKSTVFCRTRRPPGERLISSWGDELTKSTLRFCADCVAADLDTYGRSYWRREHQLPGLYWCRKHRRGLRETSRDYSYLRPPSTLIDDSEEFDFEWVRTLWSDEYIARYLGVLGALLDLGETTAAPVVRDALREAARPAGYQLHPNRGQRLLDTEVLSQQVYAKLPTKWLRATFTGYQPPTPFKLQFWLDGTLWMTTPATTVAGYALAAAILFPSGEQFVHALRQHTGAPSEPHPTVRASPPRPPVNDSEVENGAAPGQVRVRRGPKSGIPRRIWSLQRKAEIVARTYEPGVSVAHVASQEGLHPSEIYRWRRLASKGLLVTLASGESVHASEMALMRAKVAQLESSNEKLIDENRALKSAIAVFMNLATHDGSVGDRAEELHGR